MKFFATITDAVEYATRQARGLNAQHYISRAAKDGFWVASYAPFDAEETEYAIIQNDGAKLNINGNLIH